MKGGKAPLGYTIVEVMVVLAISGVMFLLASTFVNGKQARTAFTQGVNDFATRLQSLAGQVSDGQFTDIKLQQCDPQSGGTLSFNGSFNSDQGTNNKCVFLGKLFYFYTDGTAKPEKYAQLSLATAMKDKNTNQPITTLNSYVTVIQALTNTYDNPQALDVTHMRVNGAANDNFSVGFVQGLGTTNTSSAGAAAATYQSGSQTISMVYGTALNNTPGDVSDVTTNISVFAPNKVNGQVDYANKVEICLTDGVRRAKVSMDVQADGLNVDTQFLDSGQEAWCTTS
jgi:prepilin-type N-terminal cleavage/methylation domain-containing protein